MTSQYLEPHQSGARPTAYEHALAAAIESVFAEGIHELAALVARLDENGYRDPLGERWTESSFVAVMDELGRTGTSGR